MTKNGKILHNEEKSFSNATYSLYGSNRLYCYNYNYNYNSYLYCAPYKLTEGA